MIQCLKFVTAHRFLSVFVVQATLLGMDKVYYLAVMYSSLITQYIKTSTADTNSNIDICTCS